VEDSRTRTQRGEVHQAGKGDGPVVHCVNNTAAIELEDKRFMLDTVATELNTELTKRPSASQLFNRNIRVGTTLGRLGVDEELVSERSRG
jgi:hypothetical protein